MSQSTDRFIRDTAAVAADSSAVLSLLGDLSTGFIILLFTPALAACLPIKITQQQARTCGQLVLRIHIYVRMIHTYIYIMYVTNFHASYMIAVRISSSALDA